MEASSPPPGWRRAPEGWEALKGSHQMMIWDEDESSPSHMYRQWEALDLILVLAGGIQESSGLPHPWVLARLQAAYNLWKRQLKPSKCKILCSGGGTYHKPPPRNDKGFIIHESTSCLAYLSQLGVPDECLLKEFASYDTIGNGYFSLIQHICPGDFQEVGLITSQFHMPRALLIFQTLGQLFHPTTVFHPFPVRNTGMEEAILKERQKREDASRKLFEALQSTLHSPKDFHQWFHQEHQCYKALPQKEGEEDEGCNHLWQKSY